MRVFILSIVVALTSSAKVTWLPNTSFNLPLNFKDGKPPCSKQTVIFPKTLQGSVRIQGDNQAREFILPNTGEMLLDGALFFGAEDKDECVEGNKYFIDKTVSSWSDPDVWSSPLFNEATPDAERVPCTGDTVVFPENSSFAVVLPEMLQRVQGLIMAGQNHDMYSFASHVIFNNIHKNSQQFYMNSHSSLGVAIGEDPCRFQGNKGCPCQNLVLNIDCSLKFCAVLQCSNPIKPIGHCCKICGGAISFEEEQSFDYMEFKDLVHSIVASYNDDNIVYHIGLTSINKVQVVITEKGEYKGQSARVANDIDYQISNKDWVVGAQAVSLSGGPLSEANYGIKIAFLMLFLVILAFGGIYAFYYKIPIPRVYMPSLPAFGRGSTAGLLSRFDRRTESIVSLTRRDSTVTVASGVGIGTAFRNPLYDSKRGRVNVVESEVDTDNM